MTLRFNIYRQQPPCACANLEVCPDEWRWRAHRAAHKQRRPTTERQDWNSQNCTRWLCCKRSSAWGWLVVLLGARGWEVACGVKWIRVLVFNTRQPWNLILCSWYYQLMLEALGSVGMIWTSKEPRTCPYVLTHFRTSRNWRVVILLPFRIVLSLSKGDPIMKLFWTWPCASLGSGCG